MKVDNKYVREKVRECARKLLFTRGVKGWNMDMLAAEAGLAKNTLYKIIESKEKIVEQVVLDRVRENAEKIVAIGSEINDWADRGKTLEYLKTEMERFAAAMGDFEPVILPQVLQQYPAIEAKIDNLLENLSRLADAFFDKAKQDGFIKPDVDTEACIDLTRGMINYYIQQETEKEIFEDRMKKIFEYVLVGIMA